MTEETPQCVSGWLKLAVNSNIRLVFVADETFHAEKSWFNAVHWNICSVVVQGFVKGAAVGIHKQIAKVGDSSHTQSKNFYLRRNGFCTTSGHVFPNGGTQFKIVFKTLDTSRVLLCRSQSGCKCRNGRWQICWTPFVCPCLSAPLWGDLRVTC